MVSPGQLRNRSRIATLVRSTARVWLARHENSAVPGSPGYQNPAGPGYSLDPGNRGSRNAKVPHETRVQSTARILHETRIPRKARSTASTIRVSASVSARWGWDADGPSEQTPSSGALVQGEKECVSATNIGPEIVYSGGPTRPHWGPNPPETKGRRPPPFWMGG